MWQNDFIYSFLVFLKKNITKCDKQRKFHEFQNNYYKVWQKVITNRGRFYKLWEEVTTKSGRHYKKSLVLKNVVFLLFFRYIYILFFLGKGVPIIRVVNFNEKIHRDEGQKLVEIEEILTKNRSFIQLSSNI